MRPLCPQWKDNGAYLPSTSIKISYRFGKKMGGFGSGRVSTRHRGQVEDTREHPIALVRSDQNQKAVKSEAASQLLAFCKIHLIPPGRAKFPPSHLKSRGGWLHKIKLLASGWLGERPDCAVCRLVHSFDGRSGSIMGRRPPKLWASRLRAAAPVDVAGALMTFFARGRRRARVPARVRRCFGARSDSAARAPEFSRQ